MCEGRHEEQDNRKAATDRQTTKAGDCRCRISPQEAGSSPNYRHGCDDPGKGATTNINENPITEWDLRARYESSNNFPRGHGNKHTKSRSAATRQDGVY